MYLQRWWMAAAVVAVLLISDDVTATGMLKAGNIKELTSDKTWEITLSIGQVQIWDWKRDGSLCARLDGRPREEKCSDNGRWRLEGDTLCWQLEWMGKSYGYNNACVTIKQFENKPYEARRTATPNLPFFNFVLLD
jgi:hypothetical protein